MEEKITPKKRRVSDIEIKEALLATGGVQTAAAVWFKAKKNVIIDRSTICKRIKKSKMLQEAAEEATERMLDIAETGLFQLVKNGDKGAIIFILKCKGKQRGYIERQEMTGADGIPLVPERPPLYDLSKLSHEELASLARDAFKEDKGGGEN